MLVQFVKLNSLILGPFLELPLIFFLQNLTEFALFIASSSSGPHNNKNKTHLEGLMEGSCFLPSV